MNNKEIKQLFVLIDVNSKGYGHVVTKPTSLRNINLHMEIRPVKNYYYQVLTLSEAIKRNKLVGKEYLKQFM